MMKRTLSVIAVITMMGSAGNVAADTKSDDSALLKDLVSTIRALQSEVRALTAEDDVLKAEVVALQAEVETKQDVMACLYQVGTELVVDGCNLHVQDGMGTTVSYSTPLNGLGNLIIGYNEHEILGDGKTGSHNVIVGAHHAYTSQSGIVTGHNTNITGIGAAVIGGQANTASGSGATVIGGSYNDASGWGSSVSGRLDNVADEDYETLP